MEIPVILQARMSSTRLPGKVLTKVNNKPLLEYTIERLKQSIYIGKIIVATSTEKSDDPVVQYCMSNKIEVFRGDLQNVARRYYEAVRYYKLKQFIRVTADSPLIDTHIIDAGIEVFQQGKHDIVTNIQHRSFPKGESFEIHHAEIFTKYFPKFQTAEEFEHVTPYFYLHKERFNIFNLRLSDKDYSKESLAIDLAEDLIVFRKMMEDARPIMSMGWEDLLRIKKEIVAHEFAN